MWTPVRSLPAALVALAAVAVLALAGCGSASAPSPPSGVDGLVVPTPSVDPADFVAEVDNPWLPLVPGSRWEYDVPAATSVPTDPASPAGSAGPATPGAGAGTLVLEAVAGPVVAGVRTVTLERTAQDGVVTRDHYAQDRSGNVWWLGRDGVWTAGVDGAEAGLAMPATPRVGDGFRMALLPTAAPATEERGPLATVRDRGEEVRVPAGAYADTVALEVRDVAGVRTDVHARGVGLVRTGRAGLVRFDEPR